ncbi:hypothetical protein [uncultured Dokdonia sp.]|uniref:hypothetical protein n=1 Tax=uncultured Dokdonia sp. TaxID=575653 RepID=UPI0026055EE3|nr:hypothetical protein [uncultured Dokdonia sp.]
MKTSSFIYLICILCMYACGSDTNSSEGKIENEINSIYGAETSFEDIQNATLGDIKNVHVKNLNVSRSAILDTLNSTFSLNNIAAIAYENLSEEERNSYDYIGVELTQKNGEKNPYSFNIKTLKEIDATKETAYQFAESISDASYKNLESILDTGEDPVTAAKSLEDYFIGTTGTAGPVVNYYFYGLGEGQHESKTFYTHLGTFVYKNGVTQNFHVNVFEGDAVTKGYNINPVANLTR